MSGINFDANSMLARRVLGSQQQSLHRVGEQLATGLRINRGSDDPAGLIGSENLRATLKAIEGELKTLQRTGHVARTAEIALGSMSDQLAEAEALAVANANSAGMSDAERQANQMQIDSIMHAMDRTASTARFNGQNLFDGSMKLEADGQSVEIDAISTDRLGSLESNGKETSLSDVTSGNALNTVDGDLGEAQATIRAARDEINGLRGRLGGLQKYGVESRIAGLQVTMENAASAESSIRDTDFAKATAEQSRLQILEASSIHAVNMTNASASNVLDLLG